MLLVLSYCIRDRIDTRAVGDKESVATAALTDRTFEQEAGGVESPFKQSLLLFGL